MDFNIELLPPMTIQELNKKLEEEQIKLKLENKYPRFEVTYVGPKKVFSK